MKIDGKKVDELLKLNGQKRSELCTLAGLSSRTIAKIGKGEDIRESVARKIADVLGVEPSAITRGNEILRVLREERRLKVGGGLYHETQVRMTYNSNHMEGSRLTEEQTRYIFETATVGELSADVPLDDVLETNNHFRCVEYVIDHATEPLSEDFVLTLHRILKTGTSFAATYGAGLYKRLPNTVGGLETASPADVPQQMAQLMRSYAPHRSATFEQIVEFHYHFECIHPFQDGNGRVGRLIMFKECLKNDLVPFYIDDKYRYEYYNGLKQWKNEHGYLIETCRLGQDVYKRLLDYFQVSYER